MPTVDVLDLNGEKVGEIALRDDIFAVEPKPHLFHTIIRAQLAAKRQGTASTKTRSEVRASTKKPWRQKGTGRARAGTRSSPLWRGGGVIFGPKPRSYVLHVPRSVKKAAMRSALSLKLREDRLKILAHFDLPQIKTKNFLQVRDKLGLQNALIVVDGQNENLHKSARNVQGVKVLQASGLNLFDMLHHDHLVLTQDAVAYVERVYGT
jgi:large subunit ribosomal protein L4